MRAIVLTRRVAEDIELWSRATGREACGLLVGRGGREGTLRVVRATRARNIERNAPETRFELHPQDHLDAEVEALAAGWHVVGVWHSHPQGDATPSLLDRRGLCESWCSVICASRRPRAERLRAWWPAASGFVEAPLLLRPDALV